MRGLSILNEISKNALPENEVAGIRPRIGWEFELELEAARKADHVLAITATLRDLMVENGDRPGQDLPSAQRGRRAALYPGAARCEARPGARAGRPVRHRLHRLGPGL